MFTNTRINIWIHSLNIFTSEKFIVCSYKKIVIVSIINLKILDLINFLRLLYLYERKKLLKSKSFMSVAQFEKIYCIYILNNIME